MSKPQTIEEILWAVFRAGEVNQKPELEDVAEWADICLYSVSDAKQVIEAHVKQAELRAQARLLRQLKNKATDPLLGTLDVDWLFESVMDREAVIQKQLKELEQ